MDDQVFEILVEIQKSVNQILESIEKRDLSIQSSIQIEDDLIESFFNECQRLGIDENDLPVNYDLEDLKNRVSYYYKNLSKIASPRAYILKFLSQVKRAGVKNPETEQDQSQSHGLNEKEVEILLEKSVFLTEDIVQRIRDQFETYRFVGYGLPVNRFRTFEKVSFTRKALDLGLLA